MARHTGGMQVSGDYYWTRAQAQERGDERHCVREDLHEPGSPGPAEPPAAVGDELELLRRYLPSGIALYAYGVARRFKESAKQGALELAAALQPGQAAAGEAHFTGKPADEKEDEESVEAAGSPELEKLEQEIAERKRRK